MLTSHFLKLFYKKAETKKTNTETCETHHDVSCAVYFMPISYTL